MYNFSRPHSQCCAARCVSYMCVRHAQFMRTYASRSRCAFAHFARSAFAIAQFRAHRRCCLGPACAGHACGASCRQLTRRRAHAAWRCCAAGAAHCGTPSLWLRYGCEGRDHVRQMGLAPLRIHHYAAAAAAEVLTFEHFRTLPAPLLGYIAECAFAMHGHLTGILRWRAGPSRRAWQCAT